MFDLDKSFKKGLLSSKPVLIIFIVLFIVVVLQYVFFKKIVIDVKLTAKRHIENTQSELGNGDKEEDNNSNKWYRKIDNINTIDGINTIEELKVFLNNTKLDFPIRENNRWLDSDINYMNKYYSLYDKCYTLEDFKEVNLVLNNIVFNSRSMLTLQLIVNKNGMPFYSQRLLSNPDYWYVTCVPTSFSMIYETATEKYIDPVHITDFFRGKLISAIDEYNKIISYAKTYGSWIDKYIREKKLYQISGVFIYGINLYLDRYFPDIPYDLDLDYVSKNWMITYIENTHLPILIATYLPSLVRSGWTVRKNGHATVLRDFLYNIDNKTGYLNLIGVILQDPFGNPNTSYKLLDGHGIILSMEHFNTAIKSQKDDFKNSLWADPNIFRVMYLTPSKNLQSNE